MCDLQEPYGFSTVEPDYSEIDEVFGNFGFMDKDGNVVIEPQYLSAGLFSHGLCPVALNRTWYRTEGGDRFYEMHWGYIDSRGKTVLPFQYEDAKDFNLYGVAAVLDHSHKSYYLIDTSGKPIKETEGCYIIPWYWPEERYFEFSPDDPEVDHNIGLFDSKTRKVLVPPSPKIADITEMTEDAILITEYGTMGYIDFQEYWIDSNAEPLYPHLMGRGYGIVKRPNKQGCAIVALAEIHEADGPGNYFPFNGKDYVRIWRYGIAGPSGDLILPAEYDNIFQRPDGIHFTKNGKTLVVPPERLYTLIKKNH